MFSLALVVVEFLAILWFFTKLKLQNISGSYAATWWQKLAADIPSLIEHLAHNPKIEGSNPDTDTSLTF